MNFFKSVFLDEPDPPSTSEPESSSSDSTSSLPQSSHQDSASNPDLPSPQPEPSPQSSPDTGGGWTLGALVKTLTTRSESVIETYRRDLKEFSSGLKNETLTLREVANRAMKELPSSIEVTATKAQGAIDSIGSSVADIIAQGKESLLSVDFDSSDDNTYGRTGSSNSKEVVTSVGRYSRFDAQLRVIQCDVNTYLQEPDSGSAADDYEKWRLMFKSDEKGEEIEGLIGGENGVMSDIYKKLVPESVDHETFWCRYYYRVHRLEQAASVRAKLVKRVVSMDEEELSWDVDDDDNEEDNEELADEPGKKASNVPMESDKLENEDAKINDDFSQNVEEGGKIKVVKGEIRVGDDKREELVANNVEGDEKRVDVKEPPITDESAAANDNKVLPNDTPESKKVEQLTKDSNNKVVVSSDEKTEQEESIHKKEESVLTKQQSQEEEELEWDEIEDLGSGDEKKAVIPSGSSNRAEVRKRLTVAEDDDDDEDLSWDIEDDD